MKYYSEITKILYDTPEQLREGEKKAAEKKAAEELKAKERGNRAKEVEAAYKAINEAREKYEELRNKFIEDYGSFHMTVSQKTPLRPRSSVSELIDFLFDM